MEHYTDAISITLDDGVTLIVGKVPAGQGFRAGAILTTLVSPALSRLGQGASLLDAFAVATMNPQWGEKALEVAALLVTASHATGGQWGDKRAPLAPNFDTYFAGRHDLLLQWLECAVEVNLTGFFAGMRASLKKAGARLQALEAPSPKDPSQSPGAP